MYESTINLIIYRVYRTTHMQYTLEAYSRTGRGAADTAQINHVVTVQRAAMTQIDRNLFCFYVDFFLHTTAVTVDITAFSTHKKLRAILHRSLSIYSIYTSRYLLYANRRKYYTYNVIYLFWKYSHAFPRRYYNIVYVILWLRCRLIYIYILYIIICSL